MANKKFKNYAGSTATRMFEFIISFTLRICGERPGFVKYDVRDVFKKQIIITPERFHRPNKNCIAVIVDTFVDVASEIKIYNN